MWKGSLGVTNLQNYHPTPPTFSSGERFSIFQLVVLLFQENWIYICRIARNTTRLTAPQDFPCVMWVVWECKCISVCVFQLTDHWKPKKSCLTHGSLICNQTSLWYIHLLANPQPMTQLDPVTTVNLNLCSYESCHDTSVSHTTATITVHYQKEIEAKVCCILAPHLQMKQEGYFLLSWLLLSVCCLGVFVYVSCVCLDGNEVPD